MTTSVDSRRDDETTWNRPLTEALAAVRRRRNLTYGRMATESGQVRSQAWFHKQLNDPPCTNSAPTDQPTLAGLARLLDTNARQVRDWVAEEWLGVVRSDELTARAGLLVPDLEDLSTADLELVRALVARLPKADFATRMDEMMSGLDDIIAE